MNENKISCGVIKDLLPGYADGILSEDSEKLVKEHLEQCPDCRKALEAMQEDLPEADIQDEKAGSWMKKIRKNQKRSNAIVIILLVIGMILGMVLFEVQYERSKISPAVLDTTVTVNTKGMADIEISLNTSAFSQGMASAAVHKNGDVLEITVRSGSTSSTSQTVTESLNGISRIEVNGLPIWIDGQNLGSGFKMIWELRSGIVQSSEENLPMMYGHGIGLMGQFGNFTASLAENGILNVDFTMCQSAGNQDYDKPLSEDVVSLLEKDGYLYLLLIDNADKVVFEFDGRDSDEVSVTRSQFEETLKNGQTSSSIVESAAGLLGYMEQIGFDQAKLAQSGVNGTKYCQAFHLDYGTMLFNQDDEATGDISWTLYTEGEAEQSGSLYSLAPDSGMAVSCYGADEGSILELSFENGQSVKIPYETREYAITKEGSQFVVIPLPKLTD